MSEDSKKIKGRVYRINPPCPYCGEEHMYLNVRLTDEEQEKMDVFTEKCKGKNPLMVLLGKSDVLIRRRIRCCVCEKEFTIDYGLMPQEELGYYDPDMIARVGVHPVFPEKD